MVIDNNLFLYLYDKDDVIICEWTEEEIEKLRPYFRATKDI